VIIGDGANGKTCLASRFTNNVIDWDNEQYEPTTFNNFQLELPYEDDDGAEQSVSVELWDTAGQEGFENLRKLSYNGTDVYIVTYSCISAISLANIRTKWLPEVKACMEDNGEEGEPWIVLCGTKCDIRDPANKDHTSPDSAAAVI
jgi:small GTP-binding protein